MISACPHCAKALNFPPAAQAKIAAALGKLPQGKRLPLKCPHCRQVIELNKDGSSPQARQRAGAAAQSAAAAPRAARPGKAVPAAQGVPKIKPPAPPKLDWMQDLDMEDASQVDDVPMAMVLHPNEGVRQQIVETLQPLGYQCSTPATCNEAIERMQFVNFVNVMLHVNFDSPGLEQNAFHAFMREMSMSRRRGIFYVLMGPDFHTLYDLQALALSANLVLNDNDLPYLEIVLRKAIPDFERLFAPLLEALQAYGRK